MNKYEPIEGQYGAGNLNASTEQGNIINNKNMKMMNSANEQNQQMNPDGMNSYSSDTGLPSSHQVMGNAGTGPRTEARDRLVDELGLSVRATNACKHAGLYWLSEIIRFAERNDFRKIQGCGDKTAFELDDLVQKFSGYHIIDHKTWTPLKVWAYEHDVTDGELAMLFPADGQLRLFGFLERYLARIVDKKVWRVYRQYLQWTMARPTKDHVASQAGVTKERVRQMTEKIETVFPEYLVFLRDLPTTEREAFPQLPPDWNHCVITQESAAAYNAAEGTRWSPLFFALLEAMFSGKEFVWMKWSTLLGVTVVNRELDHTHPFFLEKELATRMESIVKGIATRYQEKKKYEERVSLEDLGVPVTEEIKAILAEVLPIGLDGTRIAGTELILPANQQLTNTDRVQEILADFNEETHVDEILEAWCQRFPDVPTTVDSIRSTVVREGMIFYSVGRSSTYGLRRWLQDGRPGLKEGTIKDIIEEYLQGLETMIHIDEIELEVKKYRPTTNSRSIMGNLQQDQSGRFTIQNGYVGLAGRNYSAVPAERPEASNELIKSDTPGQAADRPSMEELLSRIESTEELLKTLIINSLPGLSGGGARA